MNRVRSSRGLEKESKRNIEVMWLLKNLKPDHNTISNFRRDNPKAIKKVFRETVRVAKQNDNAQKLAKWLNNNSNVIKPSMSLGGVESTICAPSLTSHRHLTNEQKEKDGINDYLLRLSVGIEDVNDWFLPGAILFYWLRYVIPPCFLGIIG